MRTGVAPSAGVGVPRRVAHLPLPRLDPPQDQVLGQERRDPTQGRRHRPAPRVSGRRLPSDIYRPFFLHNCLFSILSLLGFGFFLFETSFTSSLPVEE